MSAPRDMVETTALAAQQDTFSLDRFAEAVLVSIFNVRSALPHQPATSVSWDMLCQLVLLVQQVSMLHQLIHWFAVRAQLM